MKKCPFCGAVIEENARFCLYCMKTFNSKVEMKSANKKNKRWLIILTALLLLLLSIIICILLFRKSGDTENKDYTNGTTVATESTTSPDENILGTTDETPDTVTGSTGLNESNPPLSVEVITPDTNTNTNLSTDKATDNQTVPSHPVTQPTTEGATNPPPKPTIPDTTADNTPQQNETHEAVNWTYRNATTYDYYKNYNKIEAYDAIIITGFTNIPSNGIYDIPEKIDGKIVVGIDMSDSGAYTFNSVGSTVKKVYLPKHLNKINGNIFSSCVNLTDIYIHGDYLYMVPSALPEKSARSSKLTLHTTDDCWCLYGAKAFSVYCSPYGANEYYALWAQLD